MTELFPFLFSGCKNASSLLLRMAGFVLQPSSTPHNFKTISYLLQSIKDTVIDSSCKKGKMLQLSILLCSACQQINNQYKMQSGKLAPVENQPEAYSIKEFLTICISLTLQRQNLWEIATAFYLFPKNAEWRTLKQVLKKAHQYSCNWKWISCREALWIALRGWYIPEGWIKSFCHSVSWICCSIISVALSNPNNNKYSREGHMTAIDS